MRGIILRELEKIEEQENVKILHCVESGSRAWGFESPDSDYDVRFIYAHTPDFYLKLERVRDVIEWKLDDVLDINGWDIAKTLRLLHASNPTLFEWSSSPVVYRTSAQWAEVAKIQNDYFLKRNGLHHYLHMAEGNYREYLTGERVKLKKYFYVLRPILACLWILERGTPPPVRFDELCKNCLEKELVPQIEKLLAIKTLTPEYGLIERNDELNGYIERNLCAIKERINSLEEQPERGWEELDCIFKRIICGGGAAQ